MSLNIGINASRARSGGAIAHLIGILHNLSLKTLKIDSIHLWSFQDLLLQIEVSDLVVTHNASYLERSLAHQLFWERCILPNELNRSNCSVLLNVDAGSICSFRPSVTICQDMLPFEPEEIRRYPFSKELIRLLLLKHVHSSSMRSSDGVIFLSHYAQRIVERFTGTLKKTVQIPHGFDNKFFLNRQTSRSDESGPFRCIYVSNVLPYKHHWNVVEAIACLRGRGFSVELDLVGGGKGIAVERLRAKISECDPEGQFVRFSDFVAHDRLPLILERCDIFIFASSCENLPVTLLEAMATGLPIACSDRGPMPEVLKDGGVYFDPENPESISSAIEDLLVHPQKCQQLEARARELASRYSWRRCAKETFSFIVHAVLQARDAVKIH